MKKKKGYAPLMLDTVKIRELREKSGLTQEQAAKSAGQTGRQWWNNIEAGRQSNIGLETLNRIARALNVPARDLLKN